MYRGGKLGCRGGFLSPSSVAQPSPADLAQGVAGVVEFLYQPNSLDQPGVEKPAALAGGRYRIDQPEHDVILNGLRRHTGNLGGLTDPHQLTCVRRGHGSHYS